MKTLCSGVRTVSKGDCGFKGNAWMWLFVCVVWRRVGGDSAKNFVFFLVHGVAVGEKGTKFWTLLIFVDF